MNPEEARLKWYVIMFTKWLASKSTSEVKILIHHTSQPEMLAKFEYETRPTPGTITYCTHCQHIFVTL